ncbi:MAG TPA: hypothetical protein P5519_01075 [Spirochaetia bacterium]|nr:hypothetical protein [Spirochaetales bacterium]HOT59588.1 hypothetical protein [Spirochaetales bacterium]HPD81053.1 hypothetical protein [Spirochaetales bacterium]HQK34154.1 hypothetical protein [Spirochaetales bacterium]HRS64463.1 hypothetical protein [Spirochaetia bacterium]
MKQLRILYLILCVSAAAAVMAQTPRPAGEIEKDLVPQGVSLRYDEKSPFAKQIQTMIEYLKIAFTENTKTVFSDDKPDVIFDLSAVQSGSTFTLTIKGTRTDTKAELLVKSASFPNLNLGTVYKFLEDTSKEAGRLLPPLPQKERVVVTEKVVEKTEVITVARGTVITFEGLPGTSINFINLKRNAKLDAEGKYTLEQEQNTSIKFRASLPGYIPIEKTIYIGKEDFGISLDLKKLPNLEMEGTLRYANLVPGIYARYYMLPGFFSLTVGGETSAIAIIPFTKPPFPYLEASAGASILLEDPLAFLSLGMSLRLFGRITLTGNDIFFPAELPFGIAFDTAINFRVVQTIRLAIGFTMRLGPLLPAYVLNHEMQPQTSIVTAIPSTLFKVTAPEPYVALRISL